MSEDNRSEITINGESVIELDYSGLHPNLLYATEGIQFNNDPYSVVDPRPEVRPFLKHILLCMINASDELEAEQSSNYWLKNNYNQYKKLEKAGISRARPLIEAFKEKHFRIQHHFCQGKDTGLRIMNKDSKIALNVIDHFSQHGIPILCVHDSFIVQKRFESELNEIMLKSYKQYSGGFEIRIK